MTSLAEDYREVISILYEMLGDFCVESEMVDDRLRKKGRCPECFRQEEHCPCKKVERVAPQIESEEDETDDHKGSAEVLAQPTDIQGVGHGSAHTWKLLDHIGSATEWTTRYRCQKCSARFVHWHDHPSDKFEAMKMYRVPLLCPNPKPT